MVLSLQGRSFLCNLPLAIAISLLLLSICLNTTTLRHCSATATPEAESHSKPVPLVGDNLNESTTRRDQGDTSGEKDSPPPFEVGAGGSVSERGTPGDGASAVHTLGQDERLICGVEGCLVSHVETEKSVPPLQPVKGEDFDLEAGAAQKRLLRSCRHCNLV